MTEGQKPDEQQKESQFSPSGVGQPSVQPLIVPEQTKPNSTRHQPRQGTDPAHPNFVQIVGGDELEPFEKQTLEISRRTYWVAIFAFLAALAAAIFVGSQVKMMSYQTQIMASQTESASASSLMDGMNTRKQLDIAQRQAITAQRALAASSRQSKAALDANVAASQLSQKAYVTIGRPDGVVAEILWPKEPKGNAGLLVYFQNNGRFPAKFNWGSDSTIIAIVPTDPQVFNEDEIGKGYAELNANRMFRPMYRAKSRKSSQVQWSGTIDIAGGSSYQGVLWEVPKERMLQLIKLDRPLTTSGKFEYCDGFGKRVCKRFHMSYAREPYNRFFLTFEDECSAYEMQITQPMPDYDYSPPCDAAEREELKFVIPSLPKP